MKDPAAQSMPFQALQTPHWQPSREETFDVR
jgi:hypothetical protein